MPCTRTGIPLRSIPSGDGHVLGGCAAENRGADCVKLLAPAPCARTRNWTGHREPHNQTTLACTAPVPVSTAIMAPVNYDVN